MRKAECELGVPEGNEGKRICPYGGEINSCSFSQHIKCLKASVRANEFTIHHLNSQSETSDNSRFDQRRIGH